MKALKQFAVLLAFFGSTVAFSQTSFQPGTVFIKNPAADNAAAYFSGSTVYNFEVYKVADAKALTQIIAAFQKDKDVESFSPGQINGDYQSFTLVLKVRKDKKWFSTTFKAAGLNYIRLNRAEPVEAGKL